MESDPDRRIPETAGAAGSSAALKLPPHDLEAEQAVLGGVMLDNSAWDRIADRLHEEDFYRREHRLLYRTMAELAEANQPFDVVTLAGALRQRGALEDAGGMSYVGSLASGTPSAANIRAYADIVRERSVLRQLIRAGSDVAEAAFQPEGRNSEELLDHAERVIFQIAEQTGRHREGFVGMRELVPRVVNRIDELYQRQEPVTGISTGYDDLDEQTSGLQRGDLIIVAGRPSMGKTSFAMNVVEHVAMQEKLPVAVFSMEMPADALAMRMLSSLARVQLQRVRSGRLRDDDWPRLTSTMSLLSEAPLFVDDTGGLSPTDVRARARRLQREQGGLGLIVLDYIQLMQISGYRENRSAELSEISRSLKGLAKELDVPVIALSQLNRSLEQRPNKRPVMSDLRESGAIEQDADVIAFIYRDEVYNEDSADRGIAEVIIGKQRQGPIGTVRLTFLGEYTRFENYIDNVYEGAIPG